MRLVIVESPYAGDVEENVRYARACLADCLARGEAPFASHLLYTQPGVLDDDVPGERALGIAAGFAVVVLRSGVDVEGFVRARVAGHATPAPLLADLQWPAVVPTPAALVAMRRTHRFPLSNISI